MKLHHLIDSNQFDYLPIHYAAKLTCDNSFILEALIFKVLEMKLNEKLVPQLNFNLRNLLVKKLIVLFIEIGQSRNIIFLINELETILNDFYSKTAIHSILNSAELLVIVNETWLYLQENLINSVSLKCGQRPLSLAVKANNLKIVELLFKYGADCNLFALDKSLPIHYVALNCLENTSMLDLMIKYNAISFKHNNKMENIFHLAGLTNNKKFLSRILVYLSEAKLDEKILKRSLNSLDLNQFSPLFTAISAIDSAELIGDASCAELLIQNELVNKHHVDSHKNNVYHICALYNNHKVFDCLFTNCEELNHLIYETNSNDNTFLHLAAAKNSYALFKLVFDLIRKNKINADLLRKKNSNGDSFFQLACKNGSLEILKLVLNTRFDSFNPIKDLDENLNTPLMNAILANQFETVNYLLVNNFCSIADINAENSNKQIPIHFSCLRGSVEITELLLKLGSHLNVYDLFNLNPLAYACENGNSYLVQYLLNLDINASSHNSLEVINFYYTLGYF